MEKLTILAVDDEPFNLELIEFAFYGQSHIVIHKATNGQEGIESAKHYDPDVVLLDLRMPVMDGFTALQIFKNDPELSKIPVIVVTANIEEKLKALKLGANDFLGKPFDVEELRLRCKNHAHTRQQERIVEGMNQHLEETVAQKTHELQNALVLAKETEYEISFRLGKASEFRDLETGMHIRRMSYYSQLLARLVGLPEEECELILHASPLHDIGKVGIPDSVLLKPGKLTPSEFEIMKLHTTLGGSMLEGCDTYPTINAGRIIALQHHEKFDGSGYPQGIVGEEIHLYARIVAIADVFDALTSKRVYKDPFPLEKALGIMQEGRGQHFDPQLIDLFMTNIDQFLAIQAQFPDHDEAPSIIALVEGLR